MPALLTVELFCFSLARVIKRHKLNSIRDAHPLASLLLREISATTGSEFEPLPMEPNKTSVETKVLNSGCNGLVDRQLSFPFSMPDAVRSFPGHAFPR